MGTDILNRTTQTQSCGLSSNRVLRNTYTLLSMTLLFSAMTAGILMALDLPHPGLLLTLLAALGDFL